MSAFLTELDSHLRSDCDEVHVIDSPLVYQSDLLGEITVPEKFETDLSSVPRVPIVYMLYGGRAHREGVVHDLLFRKDAADFIKFREGVEKVTFSLANKVYFEAMAVRGKSAVVRYGMYWGVCLGGWFSFRKKMVADKIA